MIQIGPRYWTPPGWDDLVQPAYSTGFDTTTGRLSLDLTNGGISFASNARYNDEPVIINYQTSHAIVPNSAFGFHMHWLQAEDHDPNWLMEYRMFSNGESPSDTWTKQIPDNLRAFTYTSGTIIQITGFPDIDLSSLSSPLSAFIQVRLYRDSANASTLFAGSDPYTADATVISPDAHIKLNRLGSANQFTG